MRATRWLAGLLALLVPVAAYAANTSVPNMTAVGSVLGTDLFYDSQSGGNNKATAAQIASYFFGTVSGDCTATGLGVITCLKTNGVSFGTAATVNTGTSGATIGLLIGALTFAGPDTFAGPLTFSGLGTGTQVSCLGLTSGNAVVPATGACGYGGSGITQLTGAVTAGPGSGSQVATIPAGQAGVVTLGCPGATGGGTINLPATTTIGIENQWFSLTGNAIVAGTCGGTVDVSGTTDTVPTIAEAGTTGFPAWWSTNICSAGTSSQTITPGAGTIGGAATYVLAAGTATAPSCVTITSDGVSNYKISFPPGGGGGSGNTTISPATGNTANNIVTMSNTTTTVKDSGTALASLAPLASPTFTGTVTMPGAGTFTSSLNTLAQPTLFTTTTGPTLSAGQLALGGTFGTPVLPGASNEGQIYLSATNGIVIQGRGSAQDIFLFNHSGNRQCQFDNSADWVCTGGVQGSTLVAAISSNSNSLSQISNSDAVAGHTAVSAQLGFSNATSTTEGSILLNGPNTTGGNGVNSFTLNGAAGMWLQGGGVNGIEINSSGLPMIMPGFTVATLPTCNSGSHGAIVRVTDATSPTYNGALTGGGAVEVPAYCNGTAWSSH